MSESNDTSHKALEDRISYLEEQNAGLKRVGGLALALILLIGGLFVSQVWKDLRGLASGGLVFLNNERREVAALTVTPRGNVAVVPVNFGGTPSLQLDHLPFNGIGIYDSQGRLRLLFGTTPDGDKAVVGCLNDAGQPIWTPLADLKTPPESHTRHKTCSRTNASSSSKWNPSRVARNAKPSSSVNPSSQRHPRSEHPGTKCHAIV